MWQASPAQLGVGGQAAGEVASREAGLFIAGNAATFTAANSADGLVDEQIAAALQRFLRSANEEVLRLQQVRPDWRGMATTAVCATDTLCSPSWCACRW